MLRFATNLMLTAGFSAAALVAQSGSPSGPQQGTAKLLDCIEAPYAYVSFRSAGAAGRAAGADGGERQGSGKRGSEIVQKLLADPSLDAVFASTDGASGGSAQALSLVRGMLARGASELELAMTGILTAGTNGRGQPLVVLRARLRRDQADRLRIELEKSTAPAAGGEVAGHRVYSMRGDGQRVAAGPGQLFEIALVGDDLVVGNDGTAVREALTPLPARTSASDQRRVLSNDERFLALRQRLEVPDGSLLAYGDWRRLGRRLKSSITGVPAQLLVSSGLGSARSVMMVIAAADASRSSEDFAATLLLDFELAEGRGRDGAPRIDGWFAATQPVAAKKLLRELPRGGLGGMVLSVDLAAVAAHSPRSAHMVWDLRDAFTAFGLDFERNLLDRLASRGTVQLHFGPPARTPAGARAVASVTPVYSVRAKSRTAAEDLFDDLRRVLEATGIGAFENAKDAKGKRLADVLRIRGAHRQMTAYVCVHDDSVLLAEDRDTLVQVQQELRRSRPRSRRDQVAGATIKSIGGELVAGLFDLDLTPLLAQLGAALPDVDLSGLPERHIGYLDTDSREGGAVVRVRVLSSR